jgi:hypothetical protein
MHAKDILMNYESQGAINPERVFFSLFQVCSLVTPFSMAPRESSQRIRVTLYRSNGGLKYKGEMRQNLFDGWGEARYSNGSVYIGNWQLGKRHGYGEFKSVDSNGDASKIYSGKLIGYFFIY